MLAISHFVSSDLNDNPHKTYWMVSTPFPMEFDRHGYGKWSFCVIITKWKCLWQGRMWFNGSSYVMTITKGNESELGFKSDNGASH